MGLRVWFLLGGGGRQTHQGRKARRIVSRLCCSVRPPGMKPSSKCTRTTAEQLLCLRLLTNNLHEFTWSSSTRMPMPPFLVVKTALAAECAVPVPVPLKTGLVAAEPRDAPSIADVPPPSSPPGCRCRSSSCRRMLRTGSRPVPSIRSLEEYHNKGFSHQHAQHPTRSTKNQMTHLHL